MDFDFDFNSMDENDNFGFDGGKGSSDQYKTVNNKFNTALFIVCIIAGLLMGIFGRAISGSDMASVLRVGLYFFVFALLLAVVIGISSMRNGRWESGVLALLMIVGGAVLTGGMGTFFEFLYELGHEKAAEPSSGYVFIIDNSGSMQSNDPEMVRFDALEQIISEMDDTKKVGVYTYASDVREVVPYGSVPPSRVSIDGRSKENAGGTEMLTCFNRVLDDTENSGDLITIINLTDGMPTDKGLFNNRIHKIEKRCRKQKTAISSVGFGAPAVAFLTDVAAETGGIYVDSQNVGTLYRDLQQAVRTARATGRDIISYRNDYTEDSVLYALLRIIFLLLLGILIAAMKCIAFGEAEQYTKILVVSAMLSLAAAILVEVLCRLGADLTTTQTIMCILLAVMPTGRQVVTYKVRPGDGYTDVRDKDTNLDDEFGKNMDNSMNEFKF